MKLLRFGDDRIGIIKGDNLVVDVSEAIKYRVEKGPQRVMEEVIADFDMYRERFAEIAAHTDGVSISTMKLLPPIPGPRKCLAAFSNYLDRPDRKLSEMPLDFFYKAPEMVGPDGTAELLDIPPVQVYQAEAELAFVIGKNAKNVVPERALECVFGYVGFFDVSARGLMRRTQFIPKGQATHGLCGPWIATRDEIPDPHNLAVRSWVNGNKRQDYNTGYMAHRIPEQIAWLTKFVQLQPGDIIATGTHHEGLAPVNDGDILEIEIERIGKAKFFAKGYGPRKEVDFIPGKTPVPQKITAV